MKISTEYRERRIRKAIIGIWADGRPFTSYAIADATKGIEHSRALAAPTVRACLADWEDRGIATLQEIQNRNGRTSWIYRWGPEDATGKDVFGFAFKHLTPADSRKLATALRPFLGAKRRAKRALLLGLAEGIGAQDLYGLPDQVHEASIQRGDDPATANGYRSVVKRALELAANAGIVAVIFPQIWEETDWEAAAYRWFRSPEVKHEVEPGTLRVYETFFRRCGEAVTELLPGVSLADLTTAHLNQVVFPHMKSVLGKPTLPGNVAAALRYVGRVIGEGPYSGRETLPGGGQGREGYLYTNDDEAGTGDFQTFRRILKDNGFAEDVVEFFDWYWDYSALPDEELWEREDEFPTRPPIRHLASNTLTVRMISLRAYLHEAVRICTKEKLPLTMANVFGSRSIKIARGVEIWWRKRADSGEVAGPFSWGLQGILQDVMMVGRAAFERELYNLGIPVTGADQEPRSGRDVKAALPSLPPEAQLYWRLYEHCDARMKHAAKDRKRRDGGHVNTDIRDIQRIFEETPPEYWATVLNRLLEEIREWKRQKGYRYYCLVEYAFFTGVLISTGGRISEFAWIRLGDGGAYRPDLQSRRRIKWAAWMRKNDRKHSAYLRETYCPEWIERLYLDHARPFFIARGLEEGRITADHDFLFVRPSDGNSLSKGWWPSTDLERKNCNDRVRKSMESFRISWQTHLAGAAAELGLLWPQYRGEGAPHAVRASFAYAIYNAFGEEAAAAYLGDSVESVRETYASDDGTKVDVSEIARSAVAGLGEADQQDLGKALEDALGRCRALEKENAKLKRQPPRNQQTGGG